MAVDPVCKTNVDPMDSDATDYDDEIYFFCSEICKRVFEEDPELFTGSEFNNRSFTYTRSGAATLPA